MAFALSVAGYAAANDIGENGTTAVKHQPPDKLARLPSKTAAGGAVFAVTPRAESGDDQPFHAPIRQIRSQ